MVVMWDRKPEEVEKIRQTFYNRLETVNNKADRRLEVACGYSFGRYTEGLRRLIECADTAMYQNKQKMKKKA